MQPTEKDFKQVAIEAAKKEGWGLPAGFDTSECSLVVTCVKAGYAMAAATPAPLADAELQELVRLEPFATPSPWAAVADMGITPHAHLLWPAGEVGQGGDFAVFDKQDDAALAAAMRNALPGLLARLAAAEAHSATLQSALESSADTNRVLVERLKLAADRLPLMAQKLGEAEDLADEEEGKNGDGYEACYNASGFVRGAILGLLRELNGGKEQSNA